MQSLFLYMFKQIALFFIFLSVVSLFAVPQIHAQTCPNTPTSGDSVSMTFSVPENNTYAVWTRLLAPDSSNNSIYLQIDGGCAINVGDNNAIPANQFTWVNFQDGNTASPIIVNLPTGNHTLKLTEREGGVGVDRLIVTTNTACVPSGLGDNCPLPTSTPVIINSPTPTATAAATNTPTPVVPTSTPVPTVTPTPAPVSDTIKPIVGIASPANGSIVTRGTTTTITANATDNVAVRQVQFSITGKGGNASCTDTTAPYTCSWVVPSKPSTGYSVTATAIDTSGNTANATIQVTSSK
jgi:hypothetical protein